MKIYAISDLHLGNDVDKPMHIFGEIWQNYVETIVADWNSKVKDEDIVLIAGDISWAMKLDEVKTDLDFIASLKGKKVFIRGNHDYWWKSPSSIRNILKENMYLIQNDSIKLGSYVFCGTRGWMVAEYKGQLAEEDEKIFARELLRLEISLKSALEKTLEGDALIALIHYPPFNSKFEDSEITKLFEKYGVKKVIYGHLHGKDVKYKLEYEKNGITYYLTSCDLLENRLVEIC
ncbi:MAG: metallophosphoesterase [Spirochaetales bacterium]